MGGFFLEDAKLVQVLHPTADAFAGAVDTLPVNCKGHTRVTFLISRGAGATGTTVGVIKAASNAAKSGAEAVTARSRTLTGDTVGNLTAVSTSGATIAAGADRAVAIDVDVRDLPEGKPWVYITLTEGVDSPVVGGIIAVLTGGRYGVGGAVLS